MAHSGWWVDMLIRMGRLGQLGGARSVSAAAISLVPLTWVSTAGIATTPMSITRTSGSGWGTASAYSNESVTGDVHLRFSASSANTAKIFGINTDPATDASYTSIDHAVQLAGNGAVVVWESGTSRGTKGSYTAATVVDIDVVGTVLTVSLDGVVVFTSGISIVANTVWFVDSAMNSVNSDVTNIQFSGSTIP